MESPKNLMIEQDIIGIGEMKAGNRFSPIMTTFGLGSCIAVIMHHPARQVGGMAHIALPDSTDSVNDLTSRPAYFADRAIPALIREINRITPVGAVQNLSIKLIGGAKTLRNENTFNIGKRNLLSIRNILWRMGTAPLVEEVGGEISRTVKFSPGTGEITVIFPDRRTRNL